MICPYDGCDYESDSERGIKVHHSTTHGESIAGAEFTCANCGKTDRKQRTEVEAPGPNFCERSCMAEYRAGVGNPNWKDESEQEFRHTDAGIAWRSAVFQRDEYTCQDCGDDSGGNLQAHHIKRRANCEENKNGIKEQYAVWNGVTLCLDCHAERHSDDYYYQMMKKNANEVMG